MDTIQRNIIKIKNAVPFSGMAFLHGLVGITVFYSILFTILSMQSESVVNTVNDNLASITLKIKRNDFEDLLGRNIALPTAPADGLYEVTALGSLPMRGPENITPFDAYKRPFTPEKGKAYIAIIVDSYGLSSSLSNKAVTTLHPDITLSLSPYAEDPTRWQEVARQYGHELWLSLPFQSADTTRKDWGSQAIMAKNSLRENRNRLLWLLGRTTGYAGVLGHTDYLRVIPNPKLRTVAEDVYDRGVGFIEVSEKSSKDILGTSLEKSGPYAKTDMEVSFLNEATLATFEQTALKNNMLLAYVTLHPRTLPLMRSWIATLEDKGLGLAPASYVALKQHSIELEQIAPEDLEVQIIEGVDASDETKPAKQSDAP